MYKLTADGCRSRRERLLQAVEADLIVIANPRHIQYLCGMYTTPMGLSSWGPNYLVLETSGRSTLIAHNFIKPDAKAAYVDEVVAWDWYDAVEN